MQSFDFKFSKFFGVTAWNPVVEEVIPPTPTLRVAYDAPFRSLKVLSRSVTPLVCMIAETRH